QRLIRFKNVTTSAWTRSVLSRLKWVKSLTNRLWNTSRILSILHLHVIWKKVSTQLPPAIKNGATVSMNVIKDSVRRLNVLKKKWKKLKLKMNRLGKTVKNAALQWFIKWDVTENSWHVRISLIAATQKQSLNRLA